MSESFEVLHVADSDISWIMGVEGNPCEYVKANTGSIVMYKNKIICYFKDNFDIGELVHKIMKGLEQKNIKDSKMYIYPINYYIQDKVDYYHDSGFIAVEI